MEPTATGGVWTSVPKRNRTPVNLAVAQCAGGSVSNIVGTPIKTVGHGFKSHQLHDEIPNDLCQLARTTATAPIDEVNEF